MNKEKLEKELHLLKKDLSRCNNRCNKIAKQLDIEPNYLIQYAMEETEKVLAYINSLKDKENAH